MQYLPERLCAQYKLCKTQANTYRREAVSNLDFVLNSVEFYSRLVMLIIFVLVSVFTVLIATKISHKLDTTKSTCEYSKL